MQSICAIEPSTSGQVSGFFPSVTFKIQGGSSQPSLLVCQVGVEENGPLLLTRRVEIPHPLESSTFMTAGWLLEVNWLMERRVKGCLWVLFLCLDSFGAPEGPATPKYSAAFLPHAAPTLPSPTETLFVAYRSIIHAGLGVRTKAVAPLLFC